jgi:CBS domain containing-hemolysin-like protein
MSPMELSLVVAGVMLALLAALVSLLVREVEAVRALALADDDVRGADALLWLVERPISTQRVSTAATVLATVAVLVGLPLPEPLAAAGALLVVLVIAPLTAFLLIGRRPERAGLVLAPLVRPLVQVVSRPLGAVSPSPRNGDDDGSDGDDDADERPDSGEEDTVLDAGERRMILSILELDETTAREIMVPRPDIVAVPADADFADVLDVVIESGRSRLPVFDPSDADHIVGVVHGRDLFARLRGTAKLDGGSDVWADLVRQPHHVPESKRADDLLRDLQAAAVHLALVVDEYGTVSGLVTIEDVLEEIVGEIVDEHDDEAPAIEALGDGRWRVDGGANVYDLGEELGVELPDEAWDTVGGLVLAQLGRLPRVGDRVRLEDVELTVSARRGRRVVEVLVALREPGADGPTDGGPAAAPQRSAAP